jgi:hypothetical protein
MKRLFEVDNTYFDNKKSAKELRDHLNKGNPAGPFKVKLGPDHWRFEAKKGKSHA